MELEIVLPVPPSKNRSYRCNRRGYLYVDSKIKKYVKLAVKTLKEQVGGVNYNGEVSVEVVFYLRKRIRRDIDNMLKTLFDVLELGKVIKDDNNVVEVVAKKVYGNFDERVEVKIKFFGEIS